MATGPNSRSRRNDALLTLPFLLLFLLQLFHHEMWRDELNVFGIATNSPTFGSLLGHLHYEGHPWLWYSLIWCLSRLTATPVNMKFLEAVIGAAIILIIGMGSPFNRITKLLLFLSYFIAFEYLVITRMYGLEFLLVLIYLRSRTSRPERIGINFALLGLVASTDVTGIVLSSSLAIEYVWFVWVRKPGAGRLVEPRKVFGGIFLYGAFVMLAALSLFPAKDLSSTISPPFKRPVIPHLSQVVGDYVAMPYYPTLNGSYAHYWDPPLRAHLYLFGVSVPFVLLAYGAIFYRNRRCLTLMASCLIFSIAFGYFVYGGSTRHYGVNFIALLAGLWLMRSAGEEIRWPAYVLLLLLAFAGIDAEIQAWRIPFSNVEKTTGWLLSHDSAALPWVGVPDFTVTSIPILAHRPIYSLNCGCEETYFLQSKHRDFFTDPQLVDALLAARKSLATNEFIFIATQEIASDEQTRLRAGGLTPTEVASFTGAAAPLEDFYIYDLKADGSILR